MSSKVAHDIIMTYLNTNWTTTPIFDFDDYLKDADLPLSAWLGVQFLASREGVSSITGSISTGYREIGIFYLHVVIPNGFNTDTAVTMCESLRDMLRGQRLSNSVVIAKVHPPTNTEGVALLIKGPWLGFAVICEYYTDLFY